MPPLAHRHLPLVGALVAAVLLVVWVRYEDTERESQRTVEQLALSQATLARALEFDLQRRVDAAVTAGGTRADAEADATRSFLAVASAISPPRQTLIFAGHPGALVGPVSELPAEVMSVASKGGTAVLPREVAVKLGLPARRAVAAWEPGSADGPGVLVVATASVERERAEREELRWLASVVLVVLLVLSFGVLAVRRDAERLRLEHALERQRLERERDEQLVRAERIAVASALSIGIAHELATPLGVIVARVESLRRAADDAAKTSLAVIDEQVASMRQVMHGFLSFARGEAPETLEVAPDELARTAARSVLHRFSPAGVQLELEVQSPLPKVRVDETLARQALINLLVNAAQASPAGSRVRLEVAAEGQAVEYRVDDEGTGIAADVADQVMRPFFTTRAGLGGSGLGLAISQELARHHGGTVELRASPRGKGTRAVLRFPVQGGRS